jgi:ATPase subunit of ABC transporter with duplicated ATPase domains
MEQKVEERGRREKEIESRQKEIAHHQKFVDRFKAKNSKARQAQSKVKMIERIADRLEELPGSSRRYPRFRFNQRRESGKEVLKVAGIRKAFGENEVLHGVDLRVNRGDRLVILGPNGIGKSTLLKIVVGDLAADAGKVEWGHGTEVGYFAQDHHESLKESEVTAERWLWGYCPDRDRGYVRGHLGLMLFSGDEGEKKVGALSGGEAARLVFSRIMLERPNVLVLDEPTNHLDLESIEALVAGLQAYDGTIILVSHDRWFVSQLASRVVEISAHGIRDYHGSYDEYVAACGDDHLDAEAVALKARRESKKAGNPRPQRSTPRPAASPERARADLQERSGAVAAEIEAAESRIADIDARFCEVSFYDATPADQVAALQAERAELAGRAERLLAEWSALEDELQRMTSAAPSG